MAHKNVLNCMDAAVGIQVVANAYMLNMPGRNTVQQMGADVIITYENAEFALEVARWAKSYGFVSPQEYARFTQAVRKRDS